MAALPNFQIESFQSESGITIKLIGEFDSATTGALIEAFETATATPDIPQVVLDLAEVSFIDSTGMRGIILIERMAGERELALTVSPPP